MMRNQLGLRTSACLLTALLGIGCGGQASDIDDNGNGSGASSGAGSSIAGAAGSNGSGSANGSGGANGSGAANGSAGLLINVGGSNGESGGSGNVGDGTPELCDGTDNDSNGIVDDVDAGGDGVCDCLNIATIGNIGPWSNGGNLFAKWLDERSPIGAVALADSEITASALQKFQIIVVLHAATMEVADNGVVAPALHAFSDAESTAFDAWVRGGGGVMTTIGYTNNESAEVVNVNKLLGKVGMGYSPTNLNLSGDVKSWDAHPVTDGIDTIYTDNGVEPDTASGMTVARGGDGKVALQVAQVGDGRVAIWGDEWVTYDSEWSDMDGQQVELFWLNLLKWLSPPTECQVPIPTRVK